MKRVLRRHLQQELMINTVHELHNGIIRTLQKGGAELEPCPLQADHRSADHGCFCGKFFTTPQGLATHKWRVHKHYSPEYSMITGAVCQACLCYFWSSARLRQHLSYAPRDGTPNRCYEILRQMDLQLPRETTKMPSHMEGLHRREAQPVLGPHQAFETAVDLNIQALAQQLEQARAERADRQNQPCGSAAQRQELLNALNAATAQWFDDFKANDSELSGIDPLDNRWFSILGAIDPALHTWAEDVFLRWGETDLGDYIESLVDGYAEPILHDAYADATNDFPSVQLHRHIRRLQMRMEKLEAQAAADLQPQPHRPVRLGTANPVERHRTQQTVIRRFGQQDEWQAAFRQAVWHTLPEDRILPCLQPQPGPDQRPHFLIAHLFSGRRRAGDLHQQLDHFASQAGLRLTILSLDTAVSGHCCNLDLRAVPWQRLCELYESGSVTATIAGPPCETFSQARYTTVEGEHGRAISPRRTTSSHGQLLLPAVMHSS